MRLWARIDVCTEGYEWQDRPEMKDHPACWHSKGPLLWLSAVFREWGGRLSEEGEEEPRCFPEYSQYDPFVREPALFQIFGDLTPTPETILAFADQWGAIEKHSFLGTWQWQIAEMREAIVLWETVASRNEEACQAYFAWERGKLNYVGPKALRNRLDRWESTGAVGTELRSLDPRSLKVGDVLTPTRDLLCQTVSSAMASLGIMAAPTADWIELSFVVDKLLDALWGQFAVAVTESKTFNRCPLCNKPFEVSPQLTRSDRKFCSDTCRVKFCQRRQAKARRMRKDGRHLREIAKLLETDMQSVKKWVGEA